MFSINLSGFLKHVVVVFVSQRLQQFEVVSGSSGLSPSAIALSV
jgi:hypothetical protein